MNVGIRELKQGLSEYLDRVAAGEMITVTDRGKAKALIIAAPGAGELQRGIDEGWIRPQKCSGLSPSRRSVGATTIAVVLAEDRGE